MPTVNIVKQYVKLDGTLLKDNSTPIIRGSSSATQIQLVSPQDPSLLSEIAFITASGKTVGYFGMRYDGLTEEVTYDNGFGEVTETWYIRSFDIPAEVTSTVSLFKSSPLKNGFRFREENPLYYGSYTTENDLPLIATASDLVDGNYATVTNPTDGGSAVSWVYDADLDSWSSLGFLKSLYLTTVPTLLFDLSISPSVVSSEAQLTSSEIEAINAWLTSLSVQVADNTDDIENLQNELQNYMLKSVYDSDGNSIVDKAEKLQNETDTASITISKDGDGLPNRIYATGKDMVIDAIDTNKQSTVDVDADYIDLFNVDLVNGNSRLTVEDGKITLMSADGTTYLSYSEADRVLSVDYGNGVVLQVGEEMYVHAVNKSGSNLVQGQVASITGSTGQTPSFVLATNANDGLAHNTIGVLTEDINNNAKGKLTRWGLVRGIDLSAFVEGDLVYLGVDGALTDVAPEPPTALVEIGIVLNANANGTLYVDIDKAHKINRLSDVSANSPNVNDVLRYTNSNVWEAGDLGDVYASQDLVNGSFVENFDCRYDVATSKLILTKSTSDPTYGTAPNTLTQQWSTGKRTLNLPISITPTFGTSSNPAHNYIYIFSTSPDVVIVSTNWPTIEHIKIGEFVFLDEAKTNTDGGPLRNQNINNHNANTTKIGSLNDIRERIRALGALWRSGVAGANAGSWINDVGGTLYWTSTSGTVFQMHLQTFDAKNTQTGDDMHIVNDFTSPYREIMTFNDITEYSDGNSIGNSYFNVFVWASINKTGEYDALFINLPSGGYTALSNALEDTDSTLDTSVPTAFRDTAFPIARLIFRKLGTSYSIEEEIDLREQKFGASGITGGTGIDNEFTDNLFRIQNVTDITKQLEFDVSTISSATTRTIFMPDEDVNLGTIKSDLSTAIQQALPYSQVTELDLDGTEKLYINDSGAKYILIQDVKDWVIATSGTFDPTTDYSSQGLVANSATFIARHSMTLDANADVKVSIKVPTTGQIATVSFPTIVSTNATRLSFDNGVTYHTLLVNGNEIQGATLSDKELTVYFDGTNWIYEESEITNVSVPYVGADGSFTSPKNGVDIVIGKKNLSPLDNYYGNNVSQIVTNGNFADGATDWTLANATGSVTDGVYSFTATAQFGNIFQNYIYESGVDYYISAKVKSDNTSVTLLIGGGSGAIQISHSGSGKYEILQGIFTPTSDGDNIQISDYRASGWTQIDVDYIMAIPLPDSITTVAQAEALLDGEYFEGLNWVGKPKTLTQLLDNRYSFGNYTLNSSIEIDNSYEDTPYLKFIADGSSSKTAEQIALTSGKTYTVLTHVIKNTQNTSAFGFELMSSGAGWSSTTYLPQLEVGIRKDLGVADGTLHRSAITSLASNGEEVIMRQVILEGDYTHLTDEQALEIIQEEEFGDFTVKGVYIPTIGKNKFDKLTANTGFVINGTTGDLITRAEGYASNYIPILSNTSYYFNDYYRLSGGINSSISFYDANKTFISAFTTGFSGGVDFTTPSNARYTRLSGLLVNIDNAQLELGTVATDYEEYEETQLHIDGELLSDRDNLEYQTDAIDFNDVVKNATTWSPTLELTNTIVFRKNLSSTLSYKVPDTSFINANVKLKIADTFFTIDTASSITTSDIESVAISGSLDDLLIRIDKSKLGGITSGDFEAYLQANDVTFIYELETPIPRNEVNNNVIDVYGQLLVEQGATYHQAGNGVIGEFEVTSAVNNNSQITQNTSSIVTAVKRQNQQQIEIDNIEKKTDLIKVTEEVDLDKVVTFTELFSGDVSVPIATSPVSGANVDLLDNYDNYDELHIYFDFLATDAEEHLDILPTGGISGTVSRVVIDTGSLGGTAISQYAFKVDFNSTNKDLLVVYNGVTVGTSTNADLAVTRIIGIKY